MPAAPQLRYADLPMPVDRGIAWAQYRDAGPVVCEDGWYSLTRREDVLAALRNPEVFSSRTAFGEFVSPVPLIPLALDPPEHTRFRRLLHPYFSAQALGALLPALHTQAGALIEEIAARGGCEVMAELATPYPSQAFLTLFGMPLADRDRLIAWKDGVIALGMVDDPGGADLSPAVQLYTYLAEAVHDQRRHPRGGVLSAVLAAQDGLTDAEAVGLSFVMILAGLDTVTTAIGATILELARRPALRRQLHEQPDLIRGFVEEMVRLEPAAPIVGRVTTQPVTVAGVRLPAGAQVRLCLGAINRDGSDTTSGDELVIDGKLHKHWGFGGGPHRCLGAHLARMELNVVVAEWLRVIPDFALAPGYRPEIAWPSATCTLRSLPVRIRPA